MVHTPGPGRPGPRPARDQVTAWIAAPTLQPCPGRPWGALQPDRLAERHIGRILDTDPAIAEHLINGADDAQTAQLLTDYSRAAAHPASTAASTPTSPA
ncbi:hypothetical protein [Streptomyces hydrogenans]|uniref:hypothetical protein n=1 Tax=Streptomyces hydrogenans TaxID=1873719 RepID=UPI0035E2D52B